jgi:hypothetical protein
MVWDHDGMLYEVNSFYSVPDDAWQYELSGNSGPPGGGPELVVSIPDSTPDEGPFTPRPSHQVKVFFHGSAGVPWPILRRFIAFVEASGDIVPPS